MREREVFAPSAIEREVFAPSAIEREVFAPLFANFDDLERKRGGTPETGPPRERLFAAAAK